MKVMFGKGVKVRKDDSVAFKKGINNLIDDLLDTYIGEKNAIDYSSFAISVNPLVNEDYTVIHLTVNVEPGKVQ